MHDTKERLLVAGRDHFVEVGAIRFSLREVARRTNVTATAVYRHFASKEALLDAVCEQGFDTFASYLLASYGSTNEVGADAAHARLMRTGFQYARFALERPHDYAAIFMTARPPKTASEPVRGPLPNKSATFSFLIDRVRDCVAAGSMPPTDPEVAALRIWAYVHGLVSLRLHGHLDAIGDDQAFLAFFMESLAWMVPRVRA